MIKAITKLWMTLLLLCVAGVANAATEYEIDQKFTSVAALEGQPFAIVNETEGKAVFGSGAQNLGYDLITTAVTGTSNSGYYFKLEASSVEGAYLLRLQTPAGEPYNIWGSPGYLNTGDPDGTHSTANPFNGCFILGLNNQNGQDIENGAVWEIEYAEGQGFALKNKGLGGYFAGPSPAPTATEPIYWTFCTLKAGGEVPDPEPVVIPEPEAPLAEGELIPDFFSICDEGGIPYGYEVKFGSEDRAYPTTYGGGARMFAFAEGGDFTKGIYFREGYIQYGNIKKLALEAGKKYIIHFNSAMWKSSGTTLDFTITKEGESEAALTQTINNTPDVNGSKDAVTGSTYSEIEFTPTADGNYILKWNAEGWKECLLANVGVKVAPAAPAGNEITIVPGDLTAIESSAFESTQGDVKIVCTSGTVTTEQIRVFKNSTISFESTKNIKKIVFTCAANGTAKYGPGCFNAQEGYTFEADGKTGTWEGSAASVQFTAESNQVRITEIKITLGDETVEPVHIANTAETAYTVAKAIELIEAGEALTDVVFVKGIVSQVDKIQNGEINYWISDDGTTANQFECYRGKGIDGADFAAVEDVEVGAEVIVTGTMKKYVPAEGDPIYEFNAGNALVTYVAPVKPLFADGKYYLFNKGTQKYLAGGSSWGTHAVVNATGLDYEIAFADGKYTLESQVSNGGDKHFLNGEWNDGLAMGWTFTEVAEGVYTMSDGTNFMTAQENGEVLLKDNAANDSAMWILKTPAERIAELANATAENPVDATFLLADANFNRNDLRVSAWKGDSFGVGGENTNMNAEKWGGNSQEFDVHQQIALPNGLYKITWNGFYRYNNTTDNTNDVAAAAHADGTEVINSFVYLNDKDFALTSIADEAAVEAYGNMPFSQKEATAAFEMGLYEQTAEIEVANDSLTVGIKKIAHMGTDWTVWDNFRLSYLGVPVVINPDKEEIAVPEGMINLIANGNLAGDDVTNFVAKEAPSDAIVGATIVAGAGENNSRGIVVKSADEVDKEGAQDWDSQFWISLSEPLADGAKLHVEFDYAANKAAKASTQAHGAPGAYQHWAAIGDVNFTTEWQHFSADVTVEGAMANMQSIAFNLAVERTATEYYFDNFGVWYEKPAPVEQWTDLIVNGNMEGESFECFYVTEQNVGGPYVAIATEGIGKDGSKAVKVQSADDPAQDWDSQFFIRLPYQLPAGTKYRVSFDYKADKEGEFDTQAHTEPGGYIHWAAIGSGKFTTEWQTYEQSGSISSDMSKEGQIMQTIAFNLAKNKVATEFIFDNVKFEVPSDVAATLTKNPAVDPKPYPVGIQTVNSEKNAEGIFNLNGQKVMKTQKGLYIMNGKKVVIK